MQYFIRKDSILYQYHLGFDPEKIAFLITIRKLVFEEMISMYIKKYIDVYHYNEIFGDNSFTTGENGKFGFMSCGEIISTDDEKVVISFKICFYSIKDKNKSDSVRMTLSCIFEITSSLCEHTLLEDFSFIKEQQAFLTLCHNNGLYGSVLSADLSTNFTKWIRNSDVYETKVNELIVTNCLKAFKKVTKRKGIVSGIMGLTNQGFLLSSMYGVYSSQFGIEGNEVCNYKETHPFGYETFCHNLDGPIDQIVHLVGFATLMQFVRENR